MLFNHLLCIIYQFSLVSLDNSTADSEDEQPYAGMRISVMEFELCYAIAVLINSVT